MKWNLGNSAEGIIWGDRREVRPSRGEVACVMVIFADINAEFKTESGGAEQDCVQICMKMDRWRQAN